MASRTHFYPSSPTAPPSQSAVAFASYIEGSLQVGHGANGCEANYVPPAKLRQYWTYARVNQVLQEHDLILDVQVIRNYYLRVFSILVYIGAVTYLTEVFTDHDRGDSKFPVEQCPWPNPPAHASLWQAFDHYQWIFFPLELWQPSLLGTRVASKRILPWKRTLIRSSDTSTVYKIEIHESCNKLRQDPQTRRPKHNFFVLKTYTQRGEAMYEKERKAFDMLSNKPSENIISYYGAFKQLDTYNLILELATGGDLLAYILKTPPPRTAQGIYDFWRSFNNVFRGLFGLHETTERAERNGGGGGNVLIVHEDLKPENILLESLVHPESQYRFVPKIADFGYSNVRNIPSDAQDERFGLDNHGSPTYSAPEISHQERFMHSGRYRLSELADIWSMGCIVSELGVWIALGTIGRTDYTKLRMEETNTITSFKGSAYRSCFHNGIDALKAVATMHDRAIKALPPCDQVTRSILEVVTKHMLASNPGDRWPADRIRSKIGHILDAFEPYVATSQVPSAPVGTGRTSSARQQAPGPYPHEPNGANPIITFPPQPPGSAALQAAQPGGTSRVNLARLRIPSAPPHPSANKRLSGQGQKSVEHLTLSLKDVEAYRNAAKKNQPVEKRIMMAVNQLQDSLQSRDHVFFFENSPSMEQYRDETISAFTSLSYLAKKIDTNGIELVFSTDASRVHRNQDTTPLIEKAKKCSFSALSMMESNLGEFFDDIIIPRLPKSSASSPLYRNRPRRASFGAGRKPLSILVFTDGQWGYDLDRAAGIEIPVERLMNIIIERGLNRTQIMLQFIRFGDDADGKRYLQYLDDFGRQKGCDIVDTEPIDGNIFKMFIGSLTLDWDELNTPVPKATGAAG